ncbi:MAG: VanZ family protein [Gemmatimonadota bacterium]
MTPGRRVAWFTLGVWLAATLVLTLSPDARVVTNSELCLVCGDRGLADVLLNIVLFLPLGICASALLGSSRLRYLAGLVVSLAIETAQVFIPGRDGSLGDIVFNAAGAALGVLIATAWARAPGLGPRAALARASAAGAAVAAVLGLTAFFLQPSLPDSRYFAQWTPDLPHLAPYDGRVLAAAVPGVALPNGRLSAEARDRLRARLDDGVDLRVVSLAGHPTDRIGAIFAVHDSLEREILLLGPDRTDLVFRIRRRVKDLRLDRPEIRMAGGLAGVSPGDTLIVDVRRRGARYCLSVAGRASRCDLGYTLGRGWALLAQAARLPPWARRILDGGWLATWFLPIGFWLRRGRAWPIPVMAGFAPLGLVPLSGAVLPTPPAQYAAALIGLGAGLLLSALASRAR